MSQDARLNPGEIRFHQAAPPPLAPGDYKVKVSHALSGAAGDGYVGARGSIDATYHAGADFTVSGPRFFLKPAEVYSVYPPAGHFGPFDNALPHIVFTRRTLPWERTIDGSPQKADAPVPWLALLLLGREDFEDRQLPAVAARKVRELLDPGGAVQGPTGLTLGGGESADDLCNTIDLPAVVAAEVVPGREDLPFLAHVREVNTGGKETLSLEQDGWFTVVLGNRLPATAKGDQGETNLACLVSLEGYAGLLPEVDKDGVPKVCLDEGKSHVRLAVLASWKFTCHGNNDFKARMGALDDTSLLVLPQDGLEAADAGTAAVREAFRLGYAGLNHTTRLGEKTVSWYRGPLVPLRMAPRSPYAFIPCADRALRYDYRVGMFAAEYAAAYELGRMMALQNRSFAGAMYRYRNRVARDLAAEKQQARLEVTLGVPANLRGQFAAKGATGYQRFEARGSLEDAIAGLFNTLTASPDSAAMATDLAPNAADHAATVLTAGVSFEMPAEVTRFFARAVLLYGVPFHYLVPAERMLPPESIRFFYVDPGWIATLIQGATSVGRLDDRDTVLDTLVRHHALDQAIVDAAKVREKGIACKEPEATKTLVDDDGNESTVAAASWPLTGFLLRSQAVEGWQGVEMRAYDDGNAELPPLRIDRLAPDVLLCIYNGKVTKLMVKQPPEGLHFGLSPLNDGQYRRLTLRKVTESSGGVEPGAQLSDDTMPAMDAPMRAPVDSSRSPTRVVRVAELAGLFAMRLEGLGHPAAKFSSAEFGVEMVESPGLVAFDSARSGS